MSQLQQSIAAVAIFVCWVTVASIWVIGALYNASKAPKRVTRASQRSFVGAVIISAVTAGAIVELVPHDAWRAIQVTGPWVTGIGLAVILPSTGFTLWARATLGRMWSLDSVVKDDHQLISSGPYSVTRHPIYTGILGMLLGSVLLVGVGRWILIPLVGVALLEVKIHPEERLLSAT